jgi:hypothetical protein
LGLLPKVDRFCISLARFLGLDELLRFWKRNAQKTNANGDAG